MFPDAETFKTTVLEDMGIDQGINIFGFTPNPFMDFILNGMTIF